MKRSFELNEKDLEMISGGNISETAVNILVGTALGIPGVVPVGGAVKEIWGSQDATPNATQKADSEALDAITGIVICGITTVVSSVALMGLGAGVLKTGQVLYNRFKGKKSQANNLDKKAC